MKRLIALVAACALAIGLVGPLSAAAGTATLPVVAAFKAEAGAPAASKGLWSNCVTEKEWARVKKAEKKSKGSVGPNRFTKLTGAKYRKVVKAHNGSPGDRYVVVSYLICGTRRGATVLWQWTSPLKESFLIGGMYWPVGVKSKPKPVTTASVTAMPFKANRGPQPNPFKAN